jgi:chemotaxis protein MotB
MSDDSQRPIIVKRVKKGAHGHHGGAWKIAYADFVTAMMAFFLLMWLLGSTTKADLQGISEFFKTPLKVSLMGGSGAGDATSVIKGGGSDITRADGQQKRGERTSGHRVTDLEAAQRELALREKQVLRELKLKIESAIASNATMSQFKNQLLIDITTDGLRVQIVDEQNRPMFAIGSAMLQPYTREIIHEIAKVINEVPNRISLSGHTDATPYSGGEGGYSNWELSSDRSNSLRRELIAGGMDDKRIARVVGLSSSVLLDPNDPYNPINRRVSIIVMNKKAEDAAVHDGGKLDVEQPEDITPEKLDAGGAQQQQ